MSSPSRSAVVSDSCKLGLEAGDVSAWRSRWRFVPFVPRFDAPCTAGLGALPDGDSPLIRLQQCGAGSEAEAPIGRSSTAPQERGLQLA